MDEIAVARIRAVAEEALRADLESGVELEDVETDPADVAANVYDDGGVTLLVEDLDVDPDEAANALAIYAEAYVAAADRVRTAEELLT